MEGLLAEGLRLYGRGEEDQAIARWREVLRLDPSNPQALDYLESTGVASAAVAETGATAVDSRAALQNERISGVVDKQAVLEAVKQREFDQALRMLYEARRRHPHDASISRSIQHIKGRLERELIAQLVDLDRVPGRAELNVPEGNLEAEIVGRLVDGISTLGDIVAVSPLGRFRTLQVLVKMLSGSMIRPVQATPVPPAPSFRERFREATLFYLRGEHAAALEAFEACAELRPDDPTVQHNLDKLRERIPER